MLFTGLLGVMLVTINCRLLNELCVLSQSHIRSKAGYLEMCKSEGMMKKWKSYWFKVCASTYLLYFKDKVSLQPLAVVTKTQQVVFFFSFFFPVKKL